MLILLLLKIFNKDIYSYQSLLNTIKITLRSTYNLFKQLKKGINLTYNILIIRRKRVLPNLFTIGFNKGINMALKLTSHCTHYVPTIPLSVIIYGYYTASSIKKFIIKKL